MRRFVLVMAGLVVMGSGVAFGQGRGVTKETWGKTAAGEAVDLYTLTNSQNATVRLSTLGATVVSLTVPDRSKKLGDVVLGFDSLDGYLKPHPYFGVIVGRYGNRIAKGQFTLDGKTFTLARNNGEN